MNLNLKCACQSGKDYLECCGRYIDSVFPAPTPEALMRSRYTAYTLAKIDYIARTQLPPAANNFDAISAAKWAKAAHWLGLTVKRAWIDAKNPTQAYVEFIAHFNFEGKAQKIHEVSEFLKIDQHWYYVSGVLQKS